MSDDTRLEPDRPKNARLLIMVIVTVVSLVAVVFLIVQFWNFTIQGEVAKKQHKPQATQLATLRAVEEGHLGGYEWVNQQEGVLRIPVARAMELTLRDWDSRPSGLMDSADKMALDAQQKAAPPAPAPGAPTTVPNPGSAPAPGTAPAPAPGGATPPAPKPATPAATPGTPNP